MKMDYWQRRYELLIDILTETYGASYIVDLLKELNKQMEMDK